MKPILLLRKVVLACLVFVVDEDAAKVSSAQAEKDRASLDGNGCSPTTANLLAAHAMKLLTATLNENTF